MPLPAPAPRQLLHKRVVQCWGYRREDGLWDIEGRLVDTKTYPFPNEDRGGAIQAGRCSRTKADQGVRTKAARTSAGRPGWADQGGRTKTGRPAQADQDQGGADRHGRTGTAAVYTDRGHRPRCPQHTDAAGRRQNRYGLEFRAARTQAVGRPKKGATRLVER